MISITNTAAFRSLLGVLILAGTSANGAVFHSNLASFNAAVGPGSYTEAFNTLPEGSLDPTPHTFSSGAFSHSINTHPEVNPALQGNPLFVAAISGGDLFLGTGNAGDLIRIDFTSGNISAVGGVFVPLDLGNNPVGDLLITLSDGTSQAISGPGLTTFSGFTADAPLSWMTIERLNVSGEVWANMNDFVVGVSVVPEPKFTGAVAAGGLILAVLVARLRSIARRKPGATRGSLEPT